MDEPGSGQGRGSFTEFDFVCTDKGQHRPFPLGKVMFRPGFDELIVVSEHSSFRAAGRASVFGGAPGYHDIKCVNCGRNPRIEDQKLVECVQRLGELGVTILDVSRLPF